MKDYSKWENIPLNEKILWNPNIKFSDLLENKSTDVLLKMDSDFNFYKT